MNAGKQDVEECISNMRLILMLHEEQVKCGMGFKTNTKKENEHPVAPYPMISTNISSARDEIPGKFE